MKTSDNLTKLCQEASILELEDQPIPSHWLVYGLMEAFETQSSAHLVQVIRDAVEVKEKVLAAEENLDEINYNLKRFEEILRRAND
jgi:hypothetical protein